MKQGPVTIDEVPYPVHVHYCLRYSSLVHQTENGQGGLSVRDIPECFTLNVNKQPK